MRRRNTYRFMLICDDWAQTVAQDSRRAFNFISGAGSPTRRYGGSRADDVSFAKLVGASIIVRVKRHGQPA